jgi:GntR family carbon starvation induced transcriptional regulator
MMYQNKNSMEIWFAGIPMTPLLTAKAGNAGETLASAVYARLRHDVITTAIPPGQKLRIRALCERYGVSLNPLREALNRATRDGLVRQSDQRGFYAAPVSPQDLTELTRARCLLAEVCLRESILRGDAAWEEGIVVAFHRLSRVPRYGPGHVDALELDPAWEAAHRVFHRSLVAACGSAQLVDMDQQLFDAADRYRHLARRSALSGTPERPDQHQAIMQAVLDKDVAKATGLLQAHYQRTAEYGFKELARISSGGRRGGNDADRR